MDAILAKMVEIAEHDVANTKPTDEKWAPRCHWKNWCSGYTI